MSILLFMIALGLIVGLSIHFADSLPARYSYTGVDLCRGCHASTAAGEIHQLWANGAHARAYHVLDSAEAREYIKTNGVDVGLCLGCHTTFGRQGLNDHERRVNEQGVGCERCHGPGSNYSQTIIMKDRGAFAHNGGSPGDLADCYSCHAAELTSGDPQCPFQTEPFNADSAWPRIAHPIRLSRSATRSDSATGPDSTTPNTSDTIPMR